MSALAASGGAGNPVLAIYGPTAAGKSVLAHAAAVAIGGEIVVADPFQRYRGLEIAADSPSPAARAEVPYHLVGDLDLSLGSSAGEYAALAHEAIDDIRARGRVAIVTGGTGLYLTAALCALEFPPPVAHGARTEAEALVDRDLAAAVERLAALDRTAYERVDRANPRRVARALERAIDGRPATGDALWSTPPRQPTVLVALTRPRDVLDRLILARVEREIGDGLIAEIERVLDRPDRDRAVDQIIGVREVALLRGGEISGEELPALLAARTRRLARAQLTWLRKMHGAVLVDLGERPADAVLAEVIAVWREGAL